MNTPVREGETIEGSRTMRNRPYPVLKYHAESTLSSAQVLKCSNTAVLFKFYFVGPTPHAQNERIRRGGGDRGRPPGTSVRLKWLIPRSSKSSRCSLTRVL